MEYFVDQILLQLKISWQACFCGSSETSQEENQHSLLPWFGNYQCSQGFISRDWPWRSLGLPDKESHIGDSHLLQVYGINEGAGCCDIKQTTGERMDLKVAGLETSAQPTDGDAWTALILDSSRSSWLPSSGEGQGSIPPFSREFQNHCF